MYTVCIYGSAIKPAIEYGVANQYLSLLKVQTSSHKYKNKRFRSHSSLFSNRYTVDEEWVYFISLTGSINNYNLKRSLVRTFSPSPYRWGQRNCWVTGRPASSSTRRATVPDRAATASATPRGRGSSHPPPPPHHPPRPQPGDPARPARWWWSWAAPACTGVALWWTPGTGHPAGDGQERRRWWWTGAAAGAGGAVDDAVAGAGGGTSAVGPAGDGRRRGRVTRLLWWIRLLLHALPRKTTGKAASWAMKRPTTAGCRCSPPRCCWWW